MTSLQVLYPLVVFDPDVGSSVFNSLELEVKIQVLDTKTLDINRKIRSIEARFASMGCTIRSQAGEYIRDLQSVLDEINHLEAEYLEKVRGKQEKRTEEDEQLEEAFDEWERSSDSQYVEAKEDRLMYLYRKIAFLTHPDRVGIDRNKQELLMQAKAFVKAKDLDGLERIWNILNGLRGSLLQRLISRLKEKETSFMEAKKKLEALLSSDTYQMLSIFEKNQAVVLANVVSQMARNISEAKYKKDQLLIALGRKAPPISYSSTTAGTTTVLYYF